MSHRSMHRYDITKACQLSLTNLHNCRWQINPCLLQRRSWCGIICICIIMFWLIDLSDVSFRKKLCLSMRCSLHLSGRVRLLNHLSGGLRLVHMVFIAFLTYVHSFRDFLDTLGTRDGRYCNWAYLAKFYVRERSLEASASPSFALDVEEPVAVVEKAAEAVQRNTVRSLLILFFNRVTIRTSKWSWQWTFRKWHRRIAVTNIARVFRGFSLDVYFARSEVQYLLVEDLIQSGRLIEGLLATVNLRLVE